MTRIEFVVYTLIVSLFIITVNTAAYFQITYVLKMSFFPEFFLIPTVLGLLLGTLFVLTRHFYLKMKEKELYEQIAKYDTLTGAMSRYSCELILDFEMRQNRRLQKPFSILMIDIDDFKKINDGFGHHIGDTVLIQLVGTILSQLRDSDTLCRWGGEEFIVILPESTQEQSAEVAHKICKSIESINFDIKKVVTVSVGIVTVIDAQESIEYYIQKADEALYKAKSNGKNCYVLAS